jgi:hypothetical protein
MRTPMEGKDMLAEELLEPSPVPPQDELERGHDDRSDAIPETRTAVVEVWLDGTPMPALVREERT